MSTDAVRSETLAAMRNATNGSGTEELWVGEAGGASGGGHPGVTDSYASGLWWLPALGEKAKSGHSVYCRQDLVGGDYGLLHDVRLTGPLLRTHAAVDQHAML